MDHLTFTLAQKMDARGIVPDAHALQALLHQVTATNNYKSDHQHQIPAAAEAAQSNSKHPELRKFHVHQLWLGGNSIGDTCSEMIAEMLRADSQLTHLSLAGNALGDAGVIVIASSITDNSTLRYLSLRDNAVGEVGALALARVLGTTCLTELSLEGNIGVGGADVSSVMTHEMFRY